MLRQNSLNRYTAGFLDVNEQHLAAIGEEHSNYPFATESVFRTRQHVTAIGEEHRNLVLMLRECFTTAFLFLNQTLAQEQTPRIVARRVAV
jgi:hypothetical protein